MKNTDIFSPTEGYDMVVSVTQKTINDQLATLANPDIGVIKTSIIFGLQRNEKKERVAKFYNTWDEVPKQADGTPVSPVISAEYLPQVQITASGTTVALVLDLNSGFAWFTDPVDGGLNKTDIKDWKYGIAINLDFAGINRQALEAGIPAPPIVIDRLKHFDDSGFKISQLLVDLTDVNLIKSDPEITTVGDAGPDTLDTFTIFMGGFLRAIQDKPLDNPFILGYTIGKTGDDPNEDKDVPKSLKPIGQTFTVYQDVTNGDISNVNFCLNTAGGQSSLGSGDHPTPGNFDSNWISASEQCNAKMIYSQFSLFETLILKPFYDSFAQSCHDTIKNAGLDIGDPPSYSAALQTRPNAKDYTVANNTSGDNIYTNAYTVDITTSEGRIDLKFHGGLSTKKTVSKDETFCTATAWASAFVNWEASMTITAEKDSEGKPILNITKPQPSITSSGSDSDENTCAKAFAWIGKIIGGILDALSLGLDNGFFTNLFAELLVPKLPGSYDVGKALDHMGNTINNSLLLPAGQEFFFMNPVADPDGNVSLELTYKTETGKLKLGHSQYEVRESPFSRMTKLPRRKSVTSSSHDNSTFRLKAAEPAVPNPYAQPLFDKFKVSSSESADAKYDINVSCELMSNSLPGMPAVPTREFCLAQDTQGNPLIFALGSDDQFNILIGKSGVDGTGFKVINLGHGFTSYQKAVCFNASQDEDGKISIAFALKDNNGNQGVFFAPRISNDLKVTDFSKISDMAVQVEGLDSDFVTQNVLVGSSADGKRPDLVIVGQLNGEKHFYQLQPTDITPSLVSFPENVFKNLISMKIGYAFAQRANMFLYELGSTMSLVTKTVPTDKRGSVVFDYSPGNTDLPVAFRHLSYNSISTVVSRTGQFASSDLLIGAATGVYRIPNGKASSMECVTDKILDVHEIWAATTATTVSLWVVASPNILWYIPGQKVQNSSSVTWGEPVQFARGVIHVAGMRSFVTNANEIFTINQDMSISRYWQDPTTTNWSSKKELMPNSNYVVNYDSYTTQIHIEQQGVPLSGAKLTASSSEWQYYAINGLIYSLDKDTMADLTTDAQGNITVISTAIDISPCILHIESPLFTETLNIYPNGKVNYHLQSVTDGQSLRSAKTQDGKPVMESGIDETTSNAVAENVAQVRGVAADGNVFPPAKQGRIFTAVETPTKEGKSFHVKHSALAKLETKHIKNGVICGMVVRNGKWQMHGEGEAEHILKDSLAVQSIGEAFGDFWHWLENFAVSVISTIEKGVVKLIDGTSFLIHKFEGGLEFVLKLVDKTIRIALKALGEVFKALTWILKLVGIDLAKILAWLGHLLGWDHIWATHQMFSKISKEFLDFANSEGTKYIEQARVAAKTLFTDINVDIRKAILPESVQKDDPAAAANATDTGSDARAVASSGSANYANYQLQHNTGSAGQDLTANGTSVFKSEISDNDAFKQFYDDVLLPAFNIISEKLGTTADDLLKLIKDTSMQNLKILLADIADAIVSTMATVVDGFLKFAEDILSDVTGLLQEELDIPIIGALWDFICDLFGEKEPLTVLNAVSLMLAIPATTVVKIITGTTPDQMNQGFDHPTFPSKVAGWLNDSPVAKPTLNGSHANGVKTEEGFQCPPELKWFSVVEGTVAPFAATASTIASIAKANGVQNPMLEKFGLGCNVVKAIMSWPVPDDDQNWTMYALRWASWLLGTAVDLIPKIPAEAKAVVNAILAILAIVVDAIEGQNALAWVADLGSTIPSCVAEAGEKDPEISIPGYAASILFGTLVALAGGIAKFAIFAEADEKSMLIVNTAKDKKVWKCINVGGA